MHILVGVTGSVAAVKYPELVLGLLKFGEVRVILTKGAVAMRRAIESYDPVSHAALADLVRAGTVMEYVDEDEWEDYCDVGTDPVLHVQVRLVGLSCGHRACRQEFFNLLRLSTVTPVGGCFGSGPVVCQYPCEVFSRPL
jgi:hypothetical protein